MCVLGCQGKRNKMIDIEFIRTDPDRVAAAAKTKGVEIDVQEVRRLDEDRRRLQTEIDTLRAERNRWSVAEAKERGPKLKAELKGLEEQLTGCDAQLTPLLLAIPNLPAADVPIGASEEENVVVRTVGDKPVFDFEPKNHWQLAEALDLIDKERAAKVTGARFAYLKGDLVKLQFAMMQFAMKVVTDEAILGKIAAGAKLEVSAKPFTLVLPPLLIRTDAYQAMDRLEPREERYKVEGEELWLQGSAEHVLGSMHAGEILAEATLPIRYAGYATSFRREAGTYGKDMEGILRMHQFDKLELESLTTAETSLVEHEFLIAIQEYLMRELGLPYQVILKCTADIGKPNARGVDLNVWLPGQGQYRETHTADNMTDYQARRLDTRVRRTKGITEFVHTNDATALSQRPLIAILENYQERNGSIRIPDVLVPYTGFDRISLDQE